MSDPYVPTADDLAFVRSVTNDAPDWTDDQLTVLISNWTMLDVDGKTVIADRWAAAALVIEGILIKRTLDATQYGDASSVKTQDVAVSWKVSSNAAIRALANRYWRMADPDNRFLRMPNGWRTLDVGTADRADLVQWPFGRNLPLSAVVNGPDPFGTDPQI